MSTVREMEMSGSGTHLIADFQGVETIGSVDELEAVVREAVAAAGATLLDLRFHKFPGHGGITGYAMLAESHISVHTWPERDYVAIDVFMCGSQSPRDSLEVLRRAFRPAFEEIHSVRRGLGTAPAPFDRSPAAPPLANQVADS